MFVKINDVRVLNLDKILDFCLHKISSKNKCYYSFQTLEGDDYYSHEFESVKELNASLQYFDTIQEALESFNSEAKTKTKFLHENTSVKESNDENLEFKDISISDFLEISDFNSNSLIKVDYVNWKGNLKKDLLIIPKNFYHGFNSFHPSPEAQLFLNGYDYEEYINKTTDAVAQKTYLMTSMSNIRIMSKKR